MLAWVQAWGMDEPNDEPNDGKKFRFVRKALVPAFEPLIAYNGCAQVHEQCYFRSRGKKESKECPVHGADAKVGAHTTVRVHLANAVHAVDPGAVILPEHWFTVQQMGDDGWFGSCTRYTSDMLVVLSNGKMVAFECDGYSHDCDLQRARDHVKDSYLASMSVPTCRLDIRDVKKKQKTTESGSAELGTVASGSMQSTTVASSTEESATVASGTEESATVASGRGQLGSARTDKQIFERELIKARVCLRAALQ